MHKNNAKVSSFFMMCALLWLKSEFLVMKKLRLSKQPRLEDFRSTAVVFYCAHTTISVLPTLGIGIAAYKKLVFVRRDSGKISCVEQDLLTNLLQVAQ